MARETQEDYLRGLFFDDHNDFADYYVTSSSQSQYHGYEANYDNEHSQHHHILQSPYSKEQEEINKNLTDMNLDDIQLPHGSYSQGMHHQEEQQLLQGQPYQGSPSLAQQYQNYSNQQQQQQGYYQAGGAISKNYYGQAHQGIKPYEQQQQQQQQQQQGYQGSLNTYTNQSAQYQAPQGYQEQFNIPAGVGGQQPQKQQSQQQQQQQLVSQQQQYQYTQTPPNSDYSSVGVSYQQQQQQHPQLHQTPAYRHQIPFHQQQQQQQYAVPQDNGSFSNSHGLYRPTHPISQQQQQQSSLHNSLEQHAGQQSSYEEPPSLSHYSQSQPQITIKLQQQIPSQSPSSLQQIPPVTHHGAYTQHAYQQIPADSQNSIPQYGHYYQPPSGHHHPQQLQQQTPAQQTSQEKSFSQREYLQGGESNYNMVNYSPHHHHNLPSDHNPNHKQVVNTYPRMSSAQSPPPFQQSVPQFQHLQQHPQLLFSSSQQNLTSQPLRLQQPQQQQIFQQTNSLQDIKDEGIQGLSTISKTSVCIPLPSAYIRGSHSYEEAGRGHKHHHHLHVAAGSASAGPAMKLTAKEQSELKLERKYKKASQTNSQIKKMQKNIKNKEEKGQEGDSASTTEANAFRKYLQKERQVGLNSQIESSKELQTKQEQEESESIDGGKQNFMACRENHKKKKQQRNMDNTSHSRFSSAQSLEHNCCAHDGGVGEQSEMITESSVSCMLAEEEEGEEEMEQHGKQQQDQRKQKQQNLDNQDEIGSQVRIRSQSSHMHDGKGLKEEENEQVEDPNNLDSNNNTVGNKNTKTPVDNSKTDEIAILADSIKHCNKKNVVKNIMSAFLTFMNDRHYRIYSEADQSCILSLYHSQQSGAATDEDDKIETIRQKFKRYIAPKSLNHYNVRLLILHPNYGPIFKYFITNPIHKWINNSKVSDLGAHIKMIGFFLSCFQDPTILEELKRHEKKRAHFS